jgi:acetyltransferase (GNAT) family protein
VAGLATATENELYTRGVRTMLAAWERVAAGSAGAAVERLDGVSVAAFPNDPERVFYNNAVLARDLETAGRRVAVEAMEAVYADARVDRFAAWVHDSDEPMQAELGRRGYTVNESTRAMGMTLDSVPRVSTPPDPAGVSFGPLDWSSYLDYLGGDGDVPEGLLAGTDPNAFRALGAWLGGENVAAAIAFDHEGDSGIFNMGTREWARRRGIGTALTVLHLREAAGRGCSTLTLQATPMAERVYAAVGFRDLGRFLEYAPRRSD